MNNTMAIFKKKLKDTIQNKTVLIQFVMFPFFPLVMSHAIDIEGMPEHFFVKTFMRMFGEALEEKETGMNVITFGDKMIGRNLVQGIKYPAASNGVFDSLHQIISQITAICEII